MSIIFLLSATFCFMLLFAAIILTINTQKIATEKRFNAYFNSKVQNTVVDGEGKAKKARSFGVFQQYWMKGIVQVNKRTSKSQQKKLDLLLRDAGLSSKLSAIEFRLIQLLISFGSGFAVMLLLTPMVENIKMVWLMAFAVGFLGLRIPMFILGKRRTQRIAEINKEMPDFFDMVNLLIEAGMGLDGAISTVCQKKKGPLSEEFRIVLEDMKRGKTRREAFYDMRMRVPSDSLQSVMTTMIQADSLGVGMVKVIRNVTVRIREQRREAAREQAMKAPVKMLFPMVFFIFPSLFIVVLGPLVVKILTGGLTG
ncbi:type II secretion system F family protein [Bacillus salacetis]|uniref:type II secretion system F family protein n=1 Tax=Bacillus salacetis TaxID=2315464 RepID=UPI003B9FCB0F